MLWWYKITGNGVERRFMHCPLSRKENGKIIWYDPKIIYAPEGLSHMFFYGQILPKGTSRKNLGFKILPGDLPMPSFREATLEEKNRYYKDLFK